MYMRIEAPARLHMGLIDLNGELGRIYGSIGLSIHAPKVVLTVEEHDELEISGEHNERVREYVDRFGSYFSIAPKGRIHVESVIKPHVGMGSGTKLALSLGTALAYVNGITSSSLEIASALGRTARSGIGTTGFDRGGFIVDGGHKTTEKDHHHPPIIFSSPFPENWRLVVACPETGEGASGKNEQEAFNTLPTPSSSLAKSISHRLVMQMFPSLLEKDIENFGSSLTVVQHLVGEYFASKQSGIFATDLSEELVAFFLEEGAYGAGQSSWGPTVYGLVENETQAQLLKTKTEDYLLNSVSAEVYITKADNQGAVITKG